MSLENCGPSLTMRELSEMLRTTLEQAPESPDPALMAQVILHCLDRIEALEADLDGRNDYRGADAGT